MKKTLFYILVIALIFIGTFLYFFPYADCISDFLESESSRNKDVQFHWVRSTNKFPSMLLEEFTVKNKKGTIVSLDTLTLTATLFKGIVFNGENEEKETKVSGNFKNGIINFDIKKYAVPDFLSANIGNGSLNMEGSFDTRNNTGKGKFSGQLTKLPTPAITKPININGVLKKKGAVSDINITLSGDGVSGNGRIYITDQPGGEGLLSGYIRLKAGLIPIKLNMEGTTNNINLKIGL